jgi:SAM-dependent methyltransferase
MIEADRIKAYWENRAAGDKSAQSTTLDFYLREIEFNSIRDAINRCIPARVFDIGCGDAYTTSRLAAAFPNIAFVGGDYAQSMIENATNNVRQLDLKNIEVLHYDILHPEATDHFDLVYTSRCLINLPGWDSQKVALRNISNILKRGGTYVMIENFIDGHLEMNHVRQQFRLPEIKVRDHNSFFEIEALLPFLKTHFDVEVFQNISSSYYLVTRVIYSKICQETGVEPDYFDPHHKWAAQLPFCGNFGPVKMMVLKKR